VSGFKFYKMFLPLFIQAPIYSSFFFATKRMAETHPSFMTGGSYWFPDLSVTDPTYVIPVLAGALLIASTEIAMGHNPNNDNPNGQQLQMMMRFLGFMIVPVCATMPASVGVYFVASGVGGLLQSVLFMTPAFKTWTGVNAEKLVITFDPPADSEESSKGVDSGDDTTHAAFAATSENSASAADDFADALVKSNRRAAAAESSASSSRRPDMMNVNHTTKQSE
jgi:hypothetical protein